MNAFFDPTADDDAILGIDNVRLELPIAGVGSRILAASVDQLIVLILLVLWMVLCMTLGALVFEEIGGMVFALLAIGSFVLDWGYYTGFEIAMDGRTPGKKAVSLRTVSHVGGRAAWSAIVIRNLLRPIDYLVGVLCMFFDVKARRIGDRVASTLVVHQRPERRGHEVGRVPASWGAHEIGVVESFLDRAGRMEIDRAQGLARRILALIERREPQFADLGDGMRPQSDPVFELMRILQVKAPLAF
jgi:uncharacterized RDD family membrane protein YckC